MPLEIVRNNITEMKADAIVNTANPNAAVGTGLDKAIYEAAGEKLIIERKKIGKIARGDAKATPAFNLNAKYIIHTVGPVWLGNEKENIEILSSCYRNSLNLAKELKCRSIAFPLISTGNYGCPKDIALQTAVNEISSFLLKNEMKVFLVVFDAKSFALSEKLFASVESYIDEHYVAQQSAREYTPGRINIPPSRTLQERRMLEESFDDDFYYDEEIRIPNFLKRRSLDEMLENSEKTFSEALLDYLIAKDKNDPDVYKKANIDRKLFSKIRNNKDYKPSKQTAVALAIALELSLAETNEFIGRAGYTLTHSSKADIIIEYFIKQKNYDIFEINEVLFYYGFKTLGV